MTPGGPGPVAAPGGPVEVLVTGAGAPVTLFLHGLAGSIAQTRPFGSGVPGTRVFAHLAGHGATPAPAAPGDAGYRHLGRQAAAVLRETGATGALGVSMGAGALLAALAGPDDTPRLDRLVLCLPPAAPDGPGADAAVLARTAAMARALDAGDVEGLAALLRTHQPAAVRGTPAVAVWARRHAAALVAGRAAPGSGLAAMLRRVPGEVPPVPVPGAAGLPDTLVVAQEGDDVHPVGAAERWARLLGGRLVVLPEASVPWRGRDALRRLVSEHLGSGQLDPGSPQGARPGLAATPGDRSIT